MMMNRFVGSSSSPLAMLAAMTLSTSATADLCFPVPVPVPGLSNAPEWDPGGTPPIRKDLFDPRWGAAPATEFESDAGGHAIYRMLLNDARTELSVSVQALVDVPGANGVYFGISTATSGTIAKAVALDLPASSPDGEPAAGSILAAWTRAGGVWTGYLTPPADFGIHDVSGWVQNPADGVAWALNFKVHLNEVGVIPGTDFQVFLGMQTSPSTPQSTPDSTLYAHIPGTNIPDNPTQWATARSIDTGCTGGITLERIKIGTTNPNPSRINTTLGATNSFFAEPDYPLGVPPAGTIRGRFRIANWGSVASPTAAWPTIINGEAVGSDALGRIQFDCPTNQAGEVCGRPTPSTTHQCMLVELSPAPGQDADITKAAVYRNMDFVPLSEMSRNAELNIAGLTEMLKDVEPPGPRTHRDIYLYLKTNNMPEHGNEPLWLPAHAMEEARRTAFAPRTPLYRPARYDHQSLRGGEAEAPSKATQPADSKPSTAAPILSKRPPESARPDHKPKPVQPQTAPEVLELTTYQTLAGSWPSYEIYPFYDTGRVRELGGKKHPVLKSMPSWTYYFEHDGRFFGFEYGLDVVGSKLEQVAPNFYKVVVPNEGSLTIVDRVVAREEPKSPAGDVDCKPLGAEHGEVSERRCGCRVVGDPSSRAAHSGLGLLGALAVLLGRRRRRLG